MKRKVFLVLAIFSLMAVGLYAQTEADFDVETSVTITYYSGSATTVKIPAKIKNLPVTAIGDPGFNGSNITSITIPSGVTSIGEASFGACKSLTSVTLPNSLTSIGNQAFNGCTSLTGITIPSSVTSIGEIAFRNCTGITSITIPSSVTSMGTDVFNGWTASQTITIRGKANQAAADKAWGEGWRNGCNAKIVYQAN